MNRQLSKIEKDLCRKSINRLTKRNAELINYLIPKTELDINFGLKATYDKTLKEYNDALESWKSEIKNNEQQIKILNEQINKGVEVKKPKK